MSGRHGRWTLDGPHHPYDPRRQSAVATVGASLADARSEIITADTEVKQSAYLTAGVGKRRPYKNLFHLLGCYLLSLLLAACSTPPAPLRPTDPEIAAAAKRGHRAFHGGRYEAAAEAYTAALQRARMLNEKAGSADSAYNLAACLFALGRCDAARSVLREAKADFASGDPGLADALLLEGAIARQQGRRDEALALADQALALKASGADAAAKILQARLLRAETQCDAGDGAAARSDLAAAQQAVRDVQTPPGLLAQIAAAEGRILGLEKKPAEAAERYDAAAEQYRRGAQPREVAAMLTLAGRCLEEAGTPAAAADRYYRAARSLYAQDDFTAAVKMLDSALAMAEKANDPDVKARAGDLLGEIKTAVKAATGK